MALNDVTISLDLNQLLGGDIDTRRTRVYVKTNVTNGTLIDTSTGETRLGDERVTLEADGTGTFTTWGVGADGNPTSWQTYVVVEYPRAGSRDRVTRTFGPYTITDADNGKTLAELEDQQAIPAEYQTAFTNQAQAYLDAQAAIAGIDDTDSAVAALLDDALVGPLTQAAGDTYVAGLIDDPASATTSSLSASIAGETFERFADNLAQRNLDLAGRADAAASLALSQQRYADVASLDEDWSDLAAWATTGVQVSGGKLYATGDAGNNSAAFYGFGTLTRATFTTRITLPAAGGSGAVVVGFTSQTSGVPDPNSLYGAFIAPQNLDLREYNQGVQANPPNPSTNRLSEDLPAGTYHVTAVVDEYGSSVAVHAADGSPARVFYIPRSEFVPGGFAIFLADTRALSGVAFEPVVARADSVTSPNRTIQTLAPRIEWRYDDASSLHGILVATPASYDSRKPIDWIFHHHGALQDELDVWEDTASYTILEAALAAGYGVISIRGQATSGDCWGADACTDEGHARRAYRWLRDHYAVRSLVLWGTSMGGLATLNMLKSRDIPNIVGWLGTYPVTNLASMFANNAGTFAASIRSAYGIAADGSDYAAKTAGNDPALLDPAMFRGVRMRLYASAADTVVSKTTNSDAFAAAVADYAPEASVVACSGEHGDASHFQPSDYVAFFDRCTGKA